VVKQGIVAQCTACRHRIQIFEGLVEHDDVVVGKPRQLYGCAPDRVWAPT